MKAKEQLKLLPKSTERDDENKTTESGPISHTICFLSTSKKFFYDEDEIDIDTPGTGNDFSPSAGSSKTKIRKSKGRKNDRSHTSDKHNTKTHRKCSLCQKVIRKQYLPTHMQIHRGEKPYKCSTCGKRFTRNANLKAHKQRLNHGHEGMERKKAKPKLKQCYVKVARCDDLIPLHTRREQLPTTSNHPQANASANVDEGGHVEEAYEDGYEVLHLWSCSVSVEEFKGKPGVTSSILQSQGDVGNVDELNDDLDIMKEKEEECEQEAMKMEMENQNEIMQTQTPTKNGTTMTMTTSVYRYKCTTCQELFEEIPKLKEHNLEVHGLQQKSFTVEVEEIEVPVENHDPTESVVSTSMENTFSSSDMSHGESSSKAIKAVSNNSSSSSSSLAVLAGKQLKRSRNSRAASKKTKRNVLRKRNLKIAPMKESKNREELTTTYSAPFDCSICGKTLCSAYSLGRHLYVHSGKRPFQCNICKKNFAFEDRLKLHETIHTGEKKYQCTVCWQRFRLIAGAWKHGIKCHQKRDCYQTVKLPIRKGRTSTKANEGKDTQSNASRRGTVKHSNPNSPLVSSPSGPSKCIVCGNYFHNLESLRKHSFLHTPNQNLECSTPAVRVTPPSFADLVEKDKLCRLRLTRCDHLIPPLTKTSDPVPSSNSSENGDHFLDIDSPSSPSSTGEIVLEQEKEGESASTRNSLECSSRDQSIEPQEEKGEPVEESQMNNVAATLNEALIDDDSPGEGLNIEREDGAEVPPSGMTLGSCEKKSEKETDLVTPNAEEATNISNDRLLAVVSEDTHQLGKEKENEVCKSNLPHNTHVESKIQPPRKRRQINPNMKGYSRRRKKKNVMKARLQSSASTDEGVFALDGIQEGNKGSETACDTHAVDMDSSRIIETTNFGAAGEIQGHVVSNSNAQNTSSSEGVDNSAGTESSVKISEECQSNNLAANDESAQPLSDGSLGIDQNTSVKLPVSGDLVNPSTTEDNISNFDCKAPGNKPDLSSTDTTDETFILPNKLFQEEIDSEGTTSVQSFHSASENLPLQTEKEQSPFLKDENEGCSEEAHKMKEPNKKKTRSRRPPGLMGYRQRKRSRKSNKNGDQCLPQVDTEPENERLSGGSVETVQISEGNVEFQDVQQKDNDSVVTSVNEEKIQQQTDNGVGNCEQSNLSTSASHVSEFDKSESMTSLSTAETTFTALVDEPSSSNEQDHLNESAEILCAGDPSNDAELTQSEVEPACNDTIHPAIDDVITKYFQALNTESKDKTDQPPNSPLGKDNKAQQPSTSDELEGSNTSLTQLSDDTVDIAQSEVDIHLKSPCHKISTSGPTDCGELKDIRHSGKANIKKVYKRRPGLFGKRKRIVKAKKHSCPPVTINITGGSKRRKVTIPAIRCSRRINSRVDVKEDAIKTSNSEDTSVLSSSMSSGVETEKVIRETLDDILTQTVSLAPATIESDIPIPTLSQEIVNTERNHVNEIIIPSEVVKANTQSDLSDATATDSDSGHQQVTPSSVDFIHEAIDAVIRGHSQDLNKESQDKPNLPFEKDIKMEGSITDKSKHTQRTSMAIIKKVIKRRSGVFGKRRKWKQTVNITKHSLARFTNRKTGGSGSKRQKRRMPATRRSPRVKSVQSRSGVHVRKDASTTSKSETEKVIRETIDNVLARTVSSAPETDTSIITPSQENLEKEISINEKNVSAGVEVGTTSDKLNDTRSVGHQRVESLSKGIVHEVIDAIVSKYSQALNKESPEIESSIQDSLISESIANDPTQKSRIFGKRRRPKQTLRVSNSSITNQRTRGSHSKRRKLRMPPIRRSGRIKGVENQSKVDGKEDVVPTSKSKDITATTPIKSPMFNEVDEEKIIRETVDDILAQTVSTAEATSSKVESQDTSMCLLQVIEEGASSGTIEDNTRLQLARPGDEMQTGSSGNEVNDDPMVTQKEQASTNPQQSNCLELRYSAQRYCDHCGKRFATLGTLRRHLRVVARREKEVQLDDTSAATTEDNITVSSDLNKVENVSLTESEKTGENDINLHEQEKSFVEECDRSEKENSTDLVEPALNKSVEETEVLQTRVAVDNAELNDKAMTDDTNDVTKTEKNSKVKENNDDARIRDKRALDLEGGTVSRSKFQCTFCKDKSFLNTYFLRLHLIREHVKTGT